MPLTYREATVLQGHWPMRSGDVSGLANLADVVPPTVVLRSRDSQPSACWTRLQHHHHASTFYLYDFNENSGSAASTLLLELQFKFPSAKILLQSACDRRPKPCDQCTSNTRYLPHRLHSWSFARTCPKEGTRKKRAAF
jgi:hypothetical protein